MFGSTKRAVFNLPIYFYIVAYVLGFSNSCAVSDPEPQADIRIIDSKIFVNETPVSSLDSVSVQVGFLIDKLYQVLHNQKKQMQEYRDSIMQEMDDLRPVNENSNPSRYTQASSIDSVRSLPYYATLHPDYRMKYEIFIKLIYTVFQAEYDAVLCLTGSNSTDSTMRVLISKDAAYCSPYVFNGLAHKPIFRKIEISQLNQFVSATESHIPNQYKPTGSFKVMIEVIQQGINVKLETVKEKNDEIESEDYILISGENSVTLPNAQGQQDWDGLGRIIHAIVTRLKQNQNSAYCEHVITLVLPPDAGFDDFTKAARVIENSSFGESREADPWYRAIVPSLYYNQIDN